MRVSDGFAESIESDFRTRQLHYIAAPHLREGGDVALQFRSGGLNRHPVLAGSFIFWRRGLDVCARIALFFGELGEEHRYLPSTSRRTLLSRTSRCVATLGVSAVLAALPVSPAFGATSDALLDQVNALRASRGVSPLTADQTLASNSATWAASMAHAGSISHQNIAALASGWDNRGENVAFAASVEAAFAGLVASPGHLANMVNPAYDSVGIGIASDPGGMLYIAQEFGDRSGDAAPAPAAAASNGLLDLPAVATPTNELKSLDPVPLPATAPTTAPAPAPAPIPAAPVAPAPSAAPVPAPAPVPPPPIAAPVVTPAPVPVAQPQPDVLSSLPSVPLPVAPSAGPEPHGLLPLTGPITGALHCTQPKLWWLG